MAPVVFVEEPTELLDETPCEFCAGGTVDCGDDRRARRCFDPDCLLHLHPCTRCRGTGLKRNQWTPAAKQPSRLNTRWDAA